MNKLSDKAREALRGAYATRGRHKGQLLARCPRSSTLVCNPYQASIAALMFMTGEQADVFHEVKNHFEALPKAYLIMAQRDREALESLGVW